MLGKISEHVQASLNYISDTIGHGQSKKYVAPDTPELH